MPMSVIVIKCALLIKAIAGVEIFLSCSMLTFSMA